MQAKAPAPMQAAAIICPVFMNSQAHHRQGQRRPRAPWRALVVMVLAAVVTLVAGLYPWNAPQHGKAASRMDRKSTRLNSSHLVISYAVFCLKKKKKT